MDALEQMAFDHCVSSVSLFKTQTFETLCLQAFQTSFKTVKRLKDVSLSFKHM